MDVNSDTRAQSAYRVRRGGGTSDVQRRPPSCIGGEHIGSAHTDAESGFCWSGRAGSRLGIRMSSILRCPPGYLEVGDIATGGLGCRRFRRVRQRGLWRPWGGPRDQFGSRLFDVTGHARPSRSSASLERQSPKATLVSHSEEFVDIAGGHIERFELARSNFRQLIAPHVELVESS